MLPISIVIPTYGRDDVLVETIRLLLSLQVVAAEILIVDQTVIHTPNAESSLNNWNISGKIRWIKRPSPSITGAMNTGLQQASSSLVLFLDDDIEPISDLVQVHSEAHLKQPSVWATVGQVMQPWQKAEAVLAPRKLQGLRTDFDFPFNSTVDHPIQNVMAGNLCVHRERALSIGGFDENFQGAAYRFETEFARRIIEAGGVIKFVGSAGIKHLRVPSGGTRKDGSHLTSASPQHGVGDHYYAFLHGGRVEAWIYSIGRVFREVRTRFHATHPWWIPVKLVGEIRAMWAGWRMAARKRREGRGARNEG
jgi:glycosyltransferase involved in cell wall biosynthesis